MAAAFGAEADVPKNGAKPGTDVVTPSAAVMSGFCLVSASGVPSGAKNVLREKLVAAYNQALGKKVAEQVYFSDFVVQ